ncbi:MAG: nucleoside transporter C-terminal domain-containing protein [Flavobacteriales bacterium]|nr:nucleoside transporter C-terminal domain-containing protein [Flavobacteriales bacterium]
MKLFLKTILGFLLLLITISCTKEKSNTTVDLLNGKWKLSSVEWLSGAVDQVPEENSYYFIINSSSSGNTFSIDDNKGSWKLKDSIIFMEYIPSQIHSKIDSLIVLNDESYQAIFKSGDEKVLTINKDGIFPEKISSMMEIILVNKNELKLYNNGDLYLYRKDIVPETSFSFTSILRGLIGIAFFLFLGWVFSIDRKSINWVLVAKGVALQIIIAVLVLKFPLIEALFDGISVAFVKLIGFTDYGFTFLFKSLVSGEVGNPIVSFAFKILPTIIFFSALVSLFYYWGIIQKVVYAFAWIMKKFMRLSGAESLAAAGNVFLGQTEAPLLVKPYLLQMTKSEMMCLMTGGMATIAGGVLAAYVGFLGGDDPEQQAFFAKHLLTASIISAPAAIVAAKMLVPETEKINEDLTISKEKIGTNALEAIANGTTDGLKLAVNVGAMLLVFIALMALCNGVLNQIGSWTSINGIIAENTPYDQLSFEFILGYLGRPLVWIMGISWEDSIYVGELLGIKTVLNEFVAYPRLGEMKADGLISERSVIMSTYLLCGFANFASIGIQIGGIGALVPSRKGLLSKLGIRSLIGGTIACILTATVIGMTL